MRPFDAPVLDVTAIESAFRRHASTLAPAEQALAARTLDRVRPPNWTLEWFLPSWLGQTSGVDPETSLRIATSNVHGLVAARLEDDLADGEVDGPDAALASRVSRGLFQTAIAMYRPLFDPGSPFWAGLERILADWRSASRESLALRGAPLKVSVLAIRGLSGRDLDWARLDSALDDALEALALYDDLCDWEADLGAGRWNALVGATGAAPQTPPNASRNRASVLLALMLGGAASSGFGAVAARARRAAAAARTFGCAPLADHLASLAARAVGQGVAVERHYAVLSDRATSLIFGAAMSGGSA